MCMCQKNTKKNIKTRSKISYKTKSIFDILRLFKSYEFVETGIYIIIPLTFPFYRLSACPLVK